ncbi:unnamed protein product [Mytilus coruscus]|uniref:B box-type domain-containing protein n=1 Tax=Mytilus coruscus TaxID=42192 RepID=A0A6J7ZWA3_MYTCO|nr:unnamed protein product [Mytilus coruscus]
MASSSRYICSNCTDEEHAITWCSECEHFLCTDCQKHHKRSKASKDHKTISTDDYCNLPKFMRETSNICKDHDKTYDFYCSFHSYHCCIECIADKHQQCKDLKPLADSLKDVKSSANIPLLKNNLKDLSESFKEVLHYLRDRIKTINNQKEEGITKIKNASDHFKKLEKQLLDDLESEYSKLKSDMEALLEQVDNRDKRVDQLQHDFFTMNKCATELQIYIGLREIENNTTPESKYLEELDSGSQLNDSNMEITVSSALQSILQEVNSFGNISIKPAPNNFKVKTVGIYQAQQLVPKVHEMDHIKPFLMNSLSVPNRYILNIPACQIFHDIKNKKCTLLLLDQNMKRMMQFSSEGVFIKHVMTFTDEPHNLCYVEGDIVAVTFRGVEKVKLVNVEKNKIKKDIQLSHQCFGVSSDGDVLVISHAKDRKIVILNHVNCEDKDMPDMSKQTLEGICVDRLSLFKGKIYGTNRSENKVYCYRITGEPLWTFTNQYISQPEGIAIDRDGFVFIASNGNNRIMGISPDGKTSKTILSENNRIRGPGAININGETGMMIVSSYIDGGDSAFIFKI